MPLVSAAMFPSLVTLLEQMHEDLQGAATSTNEPFAATEHARRAPTKKFRCCTKIVGDASPARSRRVFSTTVCREVQEIGNFRAVGVALANREDESAAPILGDLTVLLGQCPFSGSELLRDGTERYTMR